MNPHKKTVNIKRVLGGLAFSAEANGRNLSLTFSGNTRIDNPEYIFKHVALSFAKGEHLDWLEIIKAGTPKTNTIEEMQTWQGELTEWWAVVNQEAGWWEKAIVGAYADLCAREETQDETRRPTIYETMTIVYSPEPDGGYSVRIEEFPGANSQGDDINDARIMITDALLELLKYDRDKGRG